MKTANLRLPTSIHVPKPTARLPLLVTLLLGVTQLPAQTVTPASSAAQSVEQEPIIELSPFIVEASSDVGYTTSSTLAGSRLKTDFKNIAAQISVMTPDFLADIAALSAEEAFTYSLNVESFTENVGYEGYGTMNNDGKANTRSRGLTSATTSRNFFNSQIKQDSYNTGDSGITFASGPNAILFGLGSPAGIIDTRLNRAQAVRKGQLRMRTDSHGSQRVAVDYNMPILKKGATFVGARIDALYDDTKYAFEPSYDKQKRISGMLGIGLFHNRVRVDISGEYLDENSSRPAYTVAKDACSVWFDPAVPGNHTGWKPGDAYAGKTVFNRQGGPTPSYVYGAGVTNPGMYNYDGLVQVMTLGNWLGANGLLPTSYDTFKGNTLSDESIYPIKKYALYGDTHLALTRAKNLTILGQVKLIDNLYLELGTMIESFDGKSSNMFLGGQMSLNLDPNLYSPTVSSAAGGLANVPNPNYGKLFLDGQGSGQLISDWDKEVRASLAYEFDAGRRLSGLGRFAKMFGLQRLVGLASAKEQQRLSQNYNRLTQDNADGTTPAIITAGVAIKPTVDDGVKNYYYLNQNNRRFHFRQYIDVNDPNNKWGGWGGLDPYGTWTLKDYNGKDFQVALFDGAGAPSSPNSRRNFLTSKALAYQGMFFKDRLAITLGKRWDGIESKELDAAWRTQDRITGLVRSYAGAPWQRYAERPSMTNDSRGAVVHVFPWLSLHYNRATNNDTVSQSHDITGAPTDATTGFGEDYGVRVAFGGMTLRYNRYSNQNENEDAGGVFNNLRDNISNLEMRLQATNPAGWQPYGKSDSNEGFYPQLHQSIGRDYYRMVADSVSTGHEVELAGRIKKLDVRFTVARTKSIKSNISQSWLQYVIDRQPLFENMKWYDTLTGLPVVRVDNVGGTLVPVLGGIGDTPVTGWKNVLFKDNNPQTIYDYYLNTVLANTYYRTIQQDGRANDSIRQWRINSTLAYQFNKSWRVGFSTRFRDKAVIGYGTRTDNVPLLGVPTSIFVIDLNNRFYTPVQWYFDPFIAYKGTYKKLRYTVQLNISNVLDNSDLYPIFAYSQDLNKSNPLLANYNRGAIASYALQEPRNFTLSFSVGF